ncbi:MAG: DUF1573 domain-containing protein [Spirochaetales bacterium]|nr:DUF1573 domain-containing protein [Spirochaetales bacterium]
MRRTRPLALLPLLFATVVVGPARASDGLTFLPAQWGFGSISDAEPIQQEVRVQNEGPEGVRVSFVPTCDCLYVEPGQAEIASGGAEAFVLTFDPAGYAGAIDMDYIVRSTAPGLEKGLFRVSGEVRPAAADDPAGVVGASATGAAGAALSVSYYHSPGCRSCERFLAEEVPRLERELGVSLSIERRDIFEPSTYRAYLAQLERLGEEERAYPAIVAGGRVLQGDREIEAKFRELIVELADQQATGAGAGQAAGGEGTAGAGRSARTADLTVLPVVAAGLLDGINPCAFTTLIFLISALAVAGKTRRELLILGLFYAASVFVTYYLIGLGFLNALRYASSFYLVAQIIRWALVAVLAAFAALSLYDYLLIRQGKTGKILLQLPAAMKRRIHISIKARTRSGALVGSAIVLGFLVAVFELACTGQVYLPTIAYTVRSGRALRGYLYLLIYNLGFIVPLLVVFGLSFAGLSLKGLTALFQRRMGAVKLALAGLFAGLAVLTIVM